MKLLVIGIASLFVAAAPAAAQDREGAKRAPSAAVRKKARAHFERGKELQEAASYDQAIAEYEAGYALVPDPAFLFNIARSHQLSGQGDKALEKYRAYLAIRPDGDIAAEAREFSAEIERAAAARAAEEKRRADDAAREKRRTDQAGRDREAAEQRARVADSTGSAEPSDKQPSGRHGIGWRVGWIAAGAGLAGAGVLVDTLPDGASDGTLQAADFAPVALYLAGAAAVALALDVL